MLAVDTNVVIRLLLNDDAKQSQQALQLFTQNRIHLLTTVLLETEWVLRKPCGLPRDEIHHLLCSLTGLPQVTLEAPELMKTALDWFAQGMDFADALHLAASHECEAFASFDRKLATAAKKAKAMKVKAL